MIKKTSGEYFCDGIIISSRKVLTGEKKKFYALNLVIKKNSLIIKKKILESSRKILLKKKFKNHKKRKNSRIPLKVQWASQARSYKNGKSVRKKRN